MRLSDPLPRLIRLHGSVARASPKGGILFSHAEGLSETYMGFRTSARELFTELGGAEDEFDAQLPPLEPAPGGGVGAGGPAAMLGRMEYAQTAATRLKTLQGYLEGLLTTTMLTEDLTADQVESVQRAVRG